MPKTVNLKCSNCGETNEVELKKRTKGYFGLEVALWRCFLLPGFCYSVWRICSIEDIAVCQNCEKTNVW